MNILNAGDKAMSDSERKKTVKEYVDEQIKDMRKRGALTKKLSPQKYQRIVRQIERVVEASDKA
jgi:hypothetical protein